MMEDQGIQAAPSTAQFYILITSHNKTGGNHVWARRGEAINSDTVETGRWRKREREIEEGSGERSDRIRERSVRGS